MSKLSVTKSDPIGKPFNVLDQEIKMAITQWEMENPIIEESWWKKRKTNLMATVSFLVNILDKFVNTVNEFADLSGKDKKATVIYSIEKVYDYISKEIMPFWLKPFNSKIKHIVLHVIISYSIDWIVAKYQKGSWRSDEKETNNKETNN